MKNVSASQMSLHQYHYFDEGGIIFTMVIKASQSPNLVAVKPKMKVSYLCLAAPQILISALLTKVAWARSWFSACYISTDVANA